MFVEILLSIYDLVEGRVETEGTVKVNSWAYYIILRQRTKNDDHIFKWSYFQIYEQQNWDTYEGATWNMKEI